MDNVVNYVGYTMGGNKSPLKASILLGDNSTNNL